MISSIELDLAPCLEVPALNAGRSGAPGRIRIPVLRGRARGLPADLDALVLTSDLQSVELPRPGTPPRLIGEVIAETLADLADDGALPARQRTGVVLAGDLWADPACAKRGGLGPVREVWEAFADAFRWVVGVAGNHDDLGDARDVARLRSGERVRLLDGDACVRDGLRLGGVSGIIGPPRRPWRRHADAFQDAVLAALAGEPDLLVLHEGPDVPATAGERERPGSADVREVLLASDGAPLVVCGHCHWPAPLARLAGRIPVLNVDARVVVLEAVR